MSIETETIKLHIKWQGEEKIEYKKYTKKLIWAKTRKPNQNNKSNIKIMIYEVT